MRTSEEVNKRKSIRLLKEGDFDVFHPTFFDKYFLKYLHGKPFVITVHDLMPEIFGWYKGDPQIANKPELCEKAAAIIAVSENTKKDLCRLYNVPKEKVHVVYHGFPKKWIMPQGQRLIPEPYFLYIGRRGGYKNWEQTVKDFALFCRCHPEVKMVCTGAEFNDDELKLLKELNVTESIINKFASEEQLWNLYSFAIAFVFPSIYEGFGMPILEAYACGCPVMLNNKSCFPEIGGKAAIYFNSQNGQSDLFNNMEIIFSMTESERNSLRIKGFEQLKKYSWEKSANMLYDIYKSL